MEYNFVFFIDDIFFTDGLNIDIIREFNVLLEVPLQVKVDAFYNKLAFQEAMNSIEDNNCKPRVKDKIKEVFSKFKGVENFNYCEDKINIFLSKQNNQVYQFNNGKDVWAFINSNLPKRNFNINYPKHGRRRDDGILIVAQRGESQLLTTNSETQNLLDLAIFDSRKRASFLVNFDELLNNKYILFPDENTRENTFHAFHLEDNLWNTKVPKSIRKYFGR